jgi:hypothetical protein
VNVYWTLAVATLALHLAWILWVLLGWLVTRNRPLLRWLHLGSLFYALGIEVFLWPCPSAALAASPTKSPFSFITWKL